MLVVRRDFRRKWLACSGFMGGAAVFAFLRRLTPRPRLISSRILSYGVFRKEASANRRADGKRFYEATISAVKDPAETAARVFEPQFEEERARDSAQPPPGGPQAVDARIDGAISWRLAVND